MRPTLLTAFASTLSIKAAAWAAILYLSVHNCPAGFSNVKNVTALKFGEKIYPHREFNYARHWYVRGQWNLLFAMVSQLAIFEIY